MEKPTYLFTYKTTDNVTGDYYYGQHKTDNLDDGYLGSGTIISNKINKHGKSRFTREILAFYSSREELCLAEEALVTRETLMDPKCMNLSLGGQYPTNMVGAVDKDGNSIAVDTLEFHKRDDLVGHNKGTITVMGKDDDKWRRISTVEFYNNREQYRTATQGKVTVFDKEEHLHKAIHSDEYFKNKGRYSSVVGGAIVEDEDGTRVSISKEEFKNRNFQGIHKGKVTVVDAEDGKTKHVSRDEFERNPSRYKHNTKGLVTGRCITTGEKRQFRTEDITPDIKDRYKFSTRGQITVFRVGDTRFRNIPRDEYDPKIHKLVQDVKFEWYDKDNNLIVSYWGNRQRALETIPFMTNKIWHFMVKDKKVKTKDKYNDSYFKKEHWKPNRRRD